MNATAKILSTKKLTIAQKELVLNAGLSFVEYDAIKINLEEVFGDREIENAIFTSKNAVRAVQDSGYDIKKCFCVGTTTKNVLVENGQNVVETAQNASELAEIIVKKYKSDSFLFFCGNLRRDELPHILQQHNISLEEQVVYTTNLNTKKFSHNFDGVLFFSPSTVQSYISENSLDEGVAFCIGNTTASEVRKHSDTIIIANKPTVANVIVQAVKYFKNVD